MTTHQKTTETTQSDHSAGLGRELHNHAMRRVASTTNIATAVTALGVSIALGSVMPLPVYKFLVGVAVVVAVAAFAGMAYRRYVRTEPATDGAVEEAKTTS